jgi:hypothetical protein
MYRKRLVTGAIAPLIFVFVLQGSASAAPNPIDHVSGGGGTQAGANFSVNIHANLARNNNLVYTGAIKVNCSSFQTFDILSANPPTVMVWGMCTLSQDATVTTPRAGVRTLVAGTDIMVDGTFVDNGEPGRNDALCLMFSTTVVPRFRILNDCAAGPDFNNLPPRRITHGNIQIK